ncbi:hypothetical protein D5086_013016 [Populus alba]|uniref:Uncharacterized protein n=1 Tax=Populus alba TaxID=43335 RepID=A0ACC4C3R6_POPAL
MLEEGLSQFHFNLLPPKLPMYSFADDLFNLTVLQYRFMPKAPLCRLSKPEVKTKRVENVDTLHAMNLMKQFQERSLKQKITNEKKVQKPDIAFGPGAAATKPFPSWSNADAARPREKEYIEPWNFEWLHDFAMIKALPSNLIGSKLLVTGLSYPQSWSWSSLLPYLLPITPAVAVFSSLQREQEAAGARCHHQSLQFLSHFEHASQQQRGFFLYFGHRLLLQQHPSFPCRGCAGHSNTEGPPLRPSSFSQQTCLHTPSFIGWILKYMEHKPPKDAQRKYRFMPKAPPRRLSKPEVKTERVENVDTLHAMNLMKQFQERSLKPKITNEKKVQKPDIAFGPGAAATKPFPSWSTINRDQGSSSNGNADAPGQREKEYIEPWDYYSNYPVSLPMRRPYSGNSAILDEEEFAEVSEAVTYDENSTNSAVELGLMEENVEASMLFVQLPPTMPMIKRSATAAGPEVKVSSRPSGGARAIEKTCRLDELPAGYMGKVLVYRSGAVKLKLGDTLYDVSPGMNSIFAQDVVAINRGEETCCVVAEIEKRVTLIPDVDAIISRVAEM